MPAALIHNFLCWRRGLVNVMVVVVRCHSVQGGSIDMSVASEIGPSVCVAGLFASGADSMQK